MSLVHHLVPPGSAVFNLFYREYQHPTIIRGYAQHWGNAQHMCGVSTLLFCTLKELSFSDCYLFETLPRSSLTNILKDIKLDLGLPLSQTDQGGCLSGWASRDCKLGCPATFREPDHPPPTFSARGQDPITLLPVRGNVGIHLTPSQR